MLLGGGFQRFVRFEEAWEGGGGLGGVVGGACGRSTFPRCELPIIAPPPSMGSRIEIGRKDHYFIF